MSPNQMQKYLDYHERRYTVINSNTEYQEHIREYTFSIIYTRAPNSFFGLGRHYYCVTHEKSHRNIFTVYNYYSDQKTPYYYNYSQMQKITDGSYFIKAFCFKS